MWLLAGILAFSSFALGEAGATPAPQKILVLLGGSGDPAGNTTIFDQNLPQFSGLLSGGWTPTVLYDGNRAGSRAAAAAVFGPHVSSMDRAGMDRLFEAFDKSLAAGSLKKGDQVLLVIDTHGAVRTPGEATHSVALEGGERVSLDELRALRDKLAKAGVQVAIVDHSCYSGASLALADENTCVLASSSANRETFTRDGFLTGLRPGRSLEQAFREGRFADATGDMPEISTAEGREVAAMLEPLLGETYSGQLEPDYPGAGPCAERVAREEKLLALVQNLAALFDSGKVDKALLAEEFGPAAATRFESLREGFAAYDEALARHQAALDAIDALAARPTEILQDNGAPVTLGEVENFVSHPAEVAALRKNLEARAADGGLSERDRADARVDVAAIDRAMAMADDPRLLELSVRRQILSGANGEFTDLARSSERIGAEERRFFDTYYVAARRKNGGENACSRFAL
jgi:hypothetical protein